MVYNTDGKEGYEKLAALQSRYPELTIFRRFQRLNLQNLLYKQAELTHLENELCEMTQENSKAGTSIDYLQDWWTLANDEDERVQRQWHLIQTIQSKLEIYNEALSKHAALLTLERPSRNNLETLQRWLERPNMGSFPLIGIDADTWSSENEEDLVSLERRRTQEFFSNWLNGRVIPFFHRIAGRKLNSPVAGLLGTGLYEYSDKSVRQISRILSTVVASILPVISVAILFVVKSNASRMGVIAVLSSIFSVAVQLFTTARGIEVFAATSAFAAINGAYLSNSNS